MIKVLFKRTFAFFAVISLIIPVIFYFSSGQAFAAVNEFQVKLGNEVFLEDYNHLVEDKKVGLITNQTGINSQGESLIDIFHNHPNIDLRALYAPEHGIDGEAAAGEYVESYTYEELGIPVYSLYGRTREPSEEMLKDVDILLFDIQDIGARTYTYMSTLNYSMKAGAKYDTPLVVLDRPNPLGGVRVEGPVMEERFISFVGVDKLPKAHGMSAAELARFFNRNIGVDLIVIPMKDYQRNMIYQDTGLPWQQTSPNIPTLDSAFLYMATGLGQGTGVFQADKFHWIGGSELNSQEYADTLNESDLKGVKFIPEYKNNVGGVRLNITDYHDLNPARSGIYALSYAFKLEDFTVPKSNDHIVMFDKIMGTDRIGAWLQEEKSPEEIINNYTPGLEEFKEKRKQYLLDEYQKEILVRVNDTPVNFDTNPYINTKNRIMVPVRAIAEALGAGVDWNGEERSVVIERENKEVTLYIDSTSASVNGESSNMDTAPVIRNMRTMVPVRFVSEFLGENVEWKNDWKIVNIN